MKYIITVSNIWFELKENPKIVQTRGHYKFDLCLLDRIKDLQQPKVKLGIVFPGLISYKINKVLESIMEGEIRYDEMEDWDG